MFLQGLITYILFIGSTCDVMYNCAENAQCLYDDSVRAYQCRCNPGYRYVTIVKYILNKRKVNLHVTHQSGTLMLEILDYTKFTNKSNTGSQEIEDPSSIVS